ncbi:MAG: hypothetical protein HY690_04055 [Chloroflexi bacterium]|nr:hypothetical protein [Chloroflexota bacterium]
MTSFDGRLQRRLALLALGGLLAACAPAPPTPSASEGLAPSALLTAVSAAPTRAVPPAETGPAVGLQVGQRAPAFTLTTLEGKPLTSANLLAQEKPFILYFFATW